MNACRGLLRRQRRVRIREIGVDEPDSEASKASGFETGGGADQVAEVDLIRRAFERLDGTTRSLLALHYVEERPLAEIGRILGAPVGTIKWRLSNARRALGQALEAERR